MDLSKGPLAALVQTMMEESEKGARRLDTLREAIANGSYRVSAASIAEAVARSIES